MKGALRSFCSLGPVQKETQDSLGQKEWDQEKADGYSLLVKSFA